MQKKYKITFGLIVLTGIGIFAYKRIRKKDGTTELNVLVNKNISTKFAKDNEKYIENLNPQAKATFVSFLNDISKLGYAVVISSGYRASKEQAALKKQNSKNASAGFSTHEYGIALDINLVKDGKWLNKNSPLEAWRKTGIVDLAKNKYKMRWGGDFKGYLDPIHFDLGNTYDVNKLYTKALAIYGKASDIQGNKLKLT